MQNVIGIYNRGAYPVNGSPDKYYLEFDGVDEYASSAENLLSISGAFSISIWVKIGAGAGSLNRVLAQDNVGTGRLWNLYYRDQGVGVEKLWFIYWLPDGTTIGAQVSGTASLVNDGLWHNVTVTCTADTTVNGLKMYVDGALDVQATPAGIGVYTKTGSGTQLTMGSNGSWAYDGSVANTGIWNGTVLTPTQITDINSDGTTGDLSILSPSVYYPMSDQDSWDGSNWTIKDTGDDALNCDVVTVNMEEADRIILS